jgi:hypothetical protein
MCQYRNEISDLGIANDFEVSSGGIIGILFRHIPGGTEKHHDKLSRDCRCLGRDLKLSTPQYISAALPLEVTWKKRRYFLHNNVLSSYKQRNSRRIFCFNTQVNI